MSEQYKKFKEWEKHVKDRGNSYDAVEACQIAQDRPRLAIVNSQGSIEVHYSEAAPHIDVFPASQIKTPEMLLSNLLRLSRKNAMNPYILIDLFNLCNEVNGWSFNEVLSG